MDDHILQEMGIGLTGANAGLLSRPAEEYVNDAGVEALWAIKAYEHAEVYFNLLCAIDPSSLRLTRLDDDIYTEFREKFPDFKVDKVEESQLKSPEAKEKWRPFCNSFEGKVDDFNFGTLLRVNSSADYSEENSILVTRIQFYAIEIARNREGYNSDIKKNFKPKPKAAS